VNRSVLLATIITVALFTLGCDKLSPEPDYYPTTVGSTWRYEGEMLFAQGDADTFATMVQRVEITGTTTLAGGSEAAVVVSLDSMETRIGPDASITVTYDTTYIVKRDSLVLSYDSLNDNTPQTILSLPITEGKTWDVWASGDEKVEAMVLGKEDAVVPAGSFKDCWKMKFTYTGPDPEELLMHHWVADGVGMVQYRMEMESGQFTITMGLRLTHYDVKK